MLDNLGAHFEVEMWSRNGRSLPKYQVTPLTQKYLFLFLGKHFWFA